MVEEAETLVEDAAVWAFFSDLVDIMAAVTAAPVLALTAAMMAIVVLDILEEIRAPREPTPGGWKCIYLVLEVVGAWMIRIYVQRA